MLSGRCGITDSRIIASKPVAAGMRVHNTRKTSVAASQKQLSGEPDLWMRKPTPETLLIPKNNCNDAAHEESPLQKSSLIPNKTRNAAKMATSKKCPRASGLWMKRPKQENQLSTCNSDSDADPDEPKFESNFCEKSSWTPTEIECRATVHSRFDRQTNNSKNEQPWGTGASDSGDDSCDSVPICSQSSSNQSSSDYEVVSDLREHDDPSNSSAVAKGADAMVRNSMSRPTEIIDTSKLVEHGKMSTEHLEDGESSPKQDHALIDEYEKSFAYSRRLRQLLNMKFKGLDRTGIETNFLLVKAHEHPGQRMIDRWRNVDYGIPYNDQVKRQKQIEDYRSSALKKKGKKGEEAEPIYPDLIRLTVRFRKDNSENRWNNFVTFRQMQKKQNQGKDLGPVPKPNDKYMFAFQDVWSYCVVVFAKPGASVRDILDPVFARLGLERRADFVYTIGCFNDDKRAGKAKILGVPNTAQPVELYQLASELYKSNCTEIYVNDNRCEMFSIFPSYYNKKQGNQKVREEGEKKEKGKYKRGIKKGKSELSAKASASVNNNNELEVIKEESVASASIPTSASRLLREEADAFEASLSLAAGSTSKTKAGAAPSVSSFTPPLSSPERSFLECH